MTSAADALGANQPTFAARLHTRTLGNVQTIDFPSGELRHRFGLHSAIVTSLLQLTDEGNMWSASFDKTIKVTPVKTRKCKLSLTGHTDAIVCLTDNGDGKATP